jgi:hypothetical protein
LQNRRPPLSTHQLFAVSFVLHSVHRKQAWWKVLPCAVAFSAAYTVLRQLWHFSPPPPPKLIARRTFTAVRPGAASSTASAGAAAAATRAATDGGAGAAAGAGAGAGAGAAADADVGAGVGAVGDRSNGCDADLPSSAPKL